MRSLCIIPARSGSKRIPRKNIKAFCGKPILEYSIKAALDSHLFDEVVVSTDDSEISEIASKSGANVPFLRSKDTSGDIAGLSEVMIEVINRYEELGEEFDILCCLLPTAPFVTPTLLASAKKMLIENDFTSVFPIVEYGYPIQRSLRLDNGIVNLKYPENLNSRSQDLESTYHDAGQFYFIYKSILIDEKRLFTSKSGAIILSQLEVQDIDNDIDWKLAEIKYNLGKSYENMSI